MQLDKVFLDSRSMLALTVAVDPAQVATIVAAEQDFDVPAGTPPLKTSDLVFVTATSAQTKAVGICSARVKDSNTISVTFVNPTAGALTPDDVTLGLLIVRT